MAPPSSPVAKKVIIIKSDSPLCKPSVAYSIVGTGVEFVVVPCDASMKTPASWSIVIFVIPQHEFIVACQYTTVPIVNVSVYNLSNGPNKTDMVYLGK